MEKIIKKKFEKYGGVLTLKQAISEDITRVMLEKLLYLEEIERLSHGIYGLKDCFIDEFYFFQLKYPSTIFSNNTALYFYNKTERTPIKMDVTIYTGYNAETIKDKANIHRTKKEFFNIGLTQIKSPQGQIVKAYNLERTICDIIKDKKYIDLETANKAIKQCIKDKDFDSNLMWEYAETLKMYQRIKAYMEAIL